MPLTRRKFLKMGVAGGLCLGYGLPAFAEYSREPAPLLIVLFLRGGCDALSLVAPVNDTDYIAARAPELRVTDNGNQAGLPLANGLSSRVEFRLHPRLGALHELYSSGHLAVIHATGLNNGTRSHFEAQDLIEQGISSSDSRFNNSGWLARWLTMSTPSNHSIPALSAAPGICSALSGAPSALAIPDLQYGVGLPWGNNGLALLQLLHSEDATKVGRAGRQALEGLAYLDQRLPRQTDGRIQPYLAAPGTHYDANSELGRSLMTIARVARMEVGLQVASLDFGGWDTHENQPGRFANQVAVLDAQLGSFFNDMEAAGRKVTVIALSEFGRRLRSNRSQGTDHGHGGAMLLLGHAVNGGRMYGQWPGLAAGQLDRGVDLAVTTDYRAVLAEVLAKQYLADSATLSRVFPGFSLEAPLGFI